MRINLHIIQNCRLFMA